jgi:tripartite-type tricarboxylate transporter receptor subunit TctC
MISRRSIVDPGIEGCRNVDDGWTRSKYDPHKSGIGEGGRNMRMIVRLAAAAAVVAAALNGSAAAQEFQAKTVTLYVGYAPGGGYDAYARLFGRHYGKYLPGKPSVVVQNMPGAGSLVAANYMYSVAPSDGSAIGLIASSTALEPLLGNTQAKFDTAKFVWVGNINKDVAACGAWKHAGVKTWADAANKQLRFGASGPAAITAQHPAFMKNVLGAPFKIIFGYQGTNDVNLAMQRGEADATCGMLLSSARGPYKQYIDSGDLNIFIQFGRENEPFFGQATNLYSLLKTEEDKQLADFVFLQTTLSRPLMASPNTPPSIAAALRKGFDATVKDTELLEEAKKGQMDVFPMSGDEVAKYFEGFAKTPAAVIEKAKTVIVDKQ